MAITLSPYLNFAGNGREAMTYYHGIFGGELAGHYYFRDNFRDSTQNNSESVWEIQHTNLELGVATPPNAIYEIGSVTKQFTAAAIMRLRASGGAMRGPPGRSMVSRSKSSATWMIRA